MTSSNELSVLFTGGGWPPAVMDPAGPFAQPVTTLAWALFIGGAVVLAIVLAALGVALLGSDRLKARLGGEKAIWIGGFAFPAIVLSGLLIWGLMLSSSLSATQITGQEMRVRIVGEMWWWRVHYLDENGREILHDANELHIPTGQPVLLDLDAADVIHSFWVPRLSGKMDMIPGRTNRLLIEAEEPGIYKGQCAEYCGGPHALMGFVVVAHTPEDFASWRSSRLSASPQIAVAENAGTNTASPENRGNPSNGADNAAGLRLFLSSGCAACHMIRGTGANGLAGPDLTHVGSRQTLGAGILPNNIGTMTGWIANSQAIKPGNRMPSYHQLNSDELRVISDYLVSLK